MKPLWAPWRMEYVSSPKSDTNIFEEKSKSNDDRENLVLYRGKLSFILMNLYPYNNGHLLIAPYRKVNTLEKLNAEENSEIMKLSQESMKVLRSTMNADGFNLGLNIGKAAGAGIEEHLHFHIVPRWNGDNNFMPSIGNTKVMVQSLEDSYQMLIFDRWGKQLFSTNKYEIGWVGKYNGELVTKDVYSYKISSIALVGAELMITGASLTGITEIINS